MAVFGRTKIEKDLEWAHRAHVRLRNQTHQSAVKEREKLEHEMDSLDAKLLRERKKNYGR